MTDLKFHTWNGGERPVSLTTKVKVMLRNGKMTPTEEAWIFTWEHNGGPGDIVAYRVIS